MRYSKSAPRRLAGAFVRCARRVQRRPQGVHQARVARQAERVVEALRLAPAHDRVAAEARVAAQHDPYARPATAQLCDHRPEFLDGARRRILVRAPQPRAEQVIGKRCAYATWVSV